MYCARMGGSTTAHSLNAPHPPQLLTFDAYGWEPDFTSYALLVPIGLLGMVLQFSFPHINRLVKRTHLALVCAAAAGCSLGLLVHWVSLSSAVPSAQFFVGALLLDVADFSSTFHQSIISVRVPAELQLKYASLYQGLGLIGRLGGPTLGAAIYSVLSSTMGLGWALNGYTFTFTAMLLGAHVAAWPKFGKIYGDAA